MTRTNCVIDLSQNNDVLGNNAQEGMNEAAQSGIAAVIHKATQSTDHVDRRYVLRRAAAKNAGLLWGAYHFGTGDSTGAAQANFFLKHAAPDAQTLLVLDLEKNTTPGETTMSLQQARDFVTAVHQQTGRWPGLYTGKSFLASLGNTTTADPVLANCWLWVAEYPDNGGLEPTDLACSPAMPPGWAAWTLWQYCGTGGDMQPSTCPGMNVDSSTGDLGPCDRECYNGTAAQLQDFWLHPPLQLS